jgi:hypothetical protein
MRSAPRPRLVVAVAMFALAVTARAEPASDTHSPEGGWSFELVPYIWAPRIDGILHFTTSNGSSPVASITPIDYLDNLNVPFMFGGAVRHGAWSALTDIVYVDFSGEQASVRSITGPGGNVEIPVDTGSTVGLRATIWSLGGSYTAWQDESVSLDVVGGLRYFRARVSLAWQLESSGSLSATGDQSDTEDWWHGIVGVHGRVRFGRSRWFMPYHGDIGGGASGWTWLVSAGVGCAFGWGDVRVVIRDLEFDSHEDNLIERLRLIGPALGVGIRF